MDETEEHVDVLEGLEVILTARQHNNASLISHTHVIGTARIAQQSFRIPPRFDARERVFWESGC